MNNTNVYLLVRKQRDQNTMYRVFAKKAKALKTAKESTEAVITEYTAHAMPKLDMRTHGLAVIYRAACVGVSDDDFYFVVEVYEMPVWP